MCIASAPVSLPPDLRFLFSQIELRDHIFYADPQTTMTLMIFCFITDEKRGVARAKGEGEKERECTTEWGPPHAGIPACRLMRTQGPSTYQVSSVGFH